MPTSAYEFANSEIYVRYEESVRGCDAFVIQSHTAPVNEWIMEHLIMVDALKRASAKRITVVLPFYGYARQDKKHRGREPISARLMADLFKTAGADRLITVDLHADQIQGFFDGPVDHLMALPILADYVKEKYGDQQLAVVSPDAGRIKVAERWSARLGGVPLAFIHKTRRTDRPNESVANRVVGEVAGRMCVLVDDMIDTGGTIVKAAEALMDDGAAGRDHRRDPRDPLRPGRRPAEELSGHRGRRHQHPAPGSRAASSTSSPASRSPRCSPARSGRSSRTARSPRCSTATPEQLPRFAFVGGGFARITWLPRRGSVGDQHCSVIDVVGSWNPCTAPCRTAVHVLSPGRPASGSHYVTAQGFICGHSTSSRVTAERGGANV